ncbi:MAG: GNAT family N-acetyltransferase [Anaerobacillus sp.]
MKVVKETKRIPYHLLLDADPSLAHIEDYLKKGYCFVARENQEVIGVYVLLKKNNTTVEIMNIAVKESYRGKGIGKKLIRHALEKAVEFGGGNVEIGTGNSSLSQLALYQKCGFRITGIIEGFFEDYPEPIIEDGIHCRDMIRLSYRIK